MSAPIPSDSGVRVPATTEMEDAGAGAGDGAVTMPPAPAPTCPVCMEPWTCNGDHRICCIPCGHVYGRSCLERWLHRCGNDSAKCPQCGEQFEDKLIINLYAPGNLWDGCCRLEELKAHYESETDKRNRHWETALAEYMARWEEAYEQLHAEYMEKMQEYNKAVTAAESHRSGLTKALFLTVRTGAQLPEYAEPPSIPPMPWMPLKQEFLAHLTTWTPGSPAHSNNPFGRASASPHESPNHYSTSPRLS